MHACTSFFLSHCSKGSFFRFKWFSLSRWCIFLVPILKPTILAYFGNPKIAKRVNIGYVLIITEEVESRLKKFIDGLFINENTTALKIGVGYFQA